MIDIREGGREREGGRVGEKHRFAVELPYALIGWFLHVPAPGWNRQLGQMGRGSNQLICPARALVISQERSPGTGQALPKSLEDRSFPLRHGSPERLTKPPGHGPWASDIHWLLPSELWRSHCCPFHDRRVLSGLPRTRPLPTRDSVLPQGDLSAPALCQPPGTPQRLALLSMFLLDNQAGRSLS